MSERSDELRREILGLVQEYHREQWPERRFEPGVSAVPVSGRVFGPEEIEHLVDASLDFWLTTGRFAREFELAFACEIGRRCALLVNSGSSANLLAITALTSPLLGERRVRPGDEVITVAAGFPTTVNPIMQNQLVPVFIDAQIPTYNADVTALESALSSRTRAIILAHTLGNPFDLDAVVDFANRHDLWLIEDMCDAVGSTYRGRPVGTFGDLATVSFYPAHHITMGEGGAVLTDDPKLRRMVESLRDWGRDCWCEPGADNTCGQRFSRQTGALPEGYDHKYTYSHIGYNLKLTDMQAAIGVAQLSKLSEFTAVRRRNFAHLWNGLSDLQEFLILPVATQGSDPSWFGFPLAVRKDAPFSRRQLIQHLDGCRIGTRLLFGGNLLKQPAYTEIQSRQVGDLQTSEFIMQQVFWIGVYPGLTEEMLDYVVATIRDCVERPR